MLKQSKTKVHIIHSLNHSNKLYVSGSNMLEIKHTTASSAVIYAHPCQFTACQGPLTMYHSVATSVSSNTTDSTTIVRTPTIKSLLLWKMVSAVAIRQYARTSSAQHLSLWCKVARTPSYYLSTIST